MAELLAKYPSLHRGERMIGRCYMDSFFPSPPKQAGSCVRPGEQLVQGSGEKAGEAREVSQ